MSLVLRGTAEELASPRAKKVSAIATMFWDLLGSLGFLRSAEMISNNKALLLFRFLPQHVMLPFHYPARLSLPMP
jgi:hypothetical protein